MSYYLIKPLRTSYLLKEFDPEWLKRFYLASPFLSLITTRIFNFFYPRLERFQLIAWTFGVFIVAKLFFAITLPAGSQAIIVLFFFFGAVYFLLSIAVAWACLNSIFSSLAGERTFAFIAFGGMLGQFFGSWVTRELGRSDHKDLALFCSAFLMFLALLALRVALSLSTDENSLKVRNEDKGRRPWTLDLGEIWKHRYLRSIGVMVFSLAFMSTVLNLVGTRVIDERLAHVHYQEGFAHLPEGGFDFIYGLKELPEDSRLERTRDWLRARELNISPEQLMRDYENFRERQESRTRVFMADVSLYQSFLMIFIMLVLARGLFKYVGVKRLLLIMPLLSLGVGAALIFPVELSVVGAFMVSAGTFNYSMNKTSKELLYTEADDQARFRFKPIIEGPIRRFGDFGAAGLQSVCADLLGMSERWSEWMIIGVGLPLTLWWLLSVRSAGLDYERRQAGSAEGSERMLTDEPTDPKGSVDD